MAQCAGGAYWADGTIPGGTLKTTGIILSADSVFVNTTNPTFGSFAGGRPGYGIGGSNWNGNSFQSLLMYRGGGGGAKTSFKLKTALDSFQIHFKISDVRGDLFNSERQRILGYNAGTPVTASFKDPVNGVSISGNDIIGSTSTTSTVQSSIRVFFNGPVDSVVVISVASSDYVIIELMAMCSMILPEKQNINLYAKPKNNHTDFFCTVKEKGTYQLQCSANNIIWEEKGHIEKNSLTNETISFANIENEILKTYYRVLYTNNYGQNQYSNIVVVNAAAGKIDFLKIYPNPFADYVTISHIKSISNITIFDSKGIQIIMQDKDITSDKTTINTTQLPAGLYYVRMLFLNGKSITSPLLKK